MRLLLPLTCALVLAMPASGVAVPLEPPTVRPEPVVHPVDGQVGYGEAGARYGTFRNGHVHAGQDVFATAGTPLLAVRDALVLETGDDGGRGNYVALYSRSERETYVYFHMLAPTRLTVGDRVRAGDRVGRVGCTGSCWGDHLHFEIRRGRGVAGDPRDPLPLLRRLGS